MNCIGCALASGEIESLGGFVLETEFFQVAQDFEVPIPGFLIIGSKRHFNSFTEFNEQEKIEFIDILIRTRATMSRELGIE